ncbi:MAG TPA: hypothetical protein VFB62_25370 [Polyangiaceae bacterium]|nr:hypothetical protein [Polyangiaceae bacterium]
MALSARGVWLETDAAVEANEEVIVCFSPPRRMELLMLLGRVSCRCCDPRLLSPRCPKGGASVAIKFEPLDATEKMILGECVRGFPPPLPRRPSGPTYVPSVAWRNHLSKPPPPPRPRLRSEPFPLQQLLEPEPPHTEPPRPEPRAEAAPAPPAPRGRRTGVLVAALVVLFATGALGAATASDRLHTHQATATIAKTALTHEAATTRAKPRLRPPVMAQHGAAVAASFDRETIETREGQCIARRMMVLRTPPFAGQPVNLSVRVRAR